MTLFPTLPLLDMVNILKCIQSSGSRVGYPFMALICIFFLTNEVEHLFFICFLSFSVYSNLLPVLTGLFIFLL